MIKKQSAGYSGTPLSQKLGIEPGSRVKPLMAPAHYLSLLEPLPERVRISPRLRAPVNLVHLFCRSRRDLRTHLSRSMQFIPSDGMIWVSWPKKSSGVVSNLDENGVRELAFPLHLVDVKVCAVDETWSALKLVIRREHR